MGVHRTLAAAVLLLGLVGFLWAVVCRLRHRMSPALRSYVVLAAGLALLQGAIGIGLAIHGDRPAEGLHFLYGPATVVAFLGTIALARTSQEEGGEISATLFGCLVAVLLAFRALTTG